MSKTPWDRAGGDDEVLDRPTTPTAGRWDGDDDQDLSHAELEIWSPLGPGPKSGFLWSFPIQKVPRWDDEFGHEHFRTKLTSMGARRVCKKGPLKGGRKTSTPSIALW